MNLSMGFDTGELKRELLTRSYETATEWIVITGAPCSGKTTVLKKLGEHRIKWIPEMARVYIESRRDQGLDISQIRENESEFQRIIIDKKLSLERRTPSEKTIFFDRDVPDSITYYRVSGIDPNEALRQCFHFRYKTIFLLDRLPLEIDYARIENDNSSIFIQEWIEKDYKSLGYNVIHVPVMPVEKIADLILSHIKAKGGP